MNWEIISAGAEMIGGIAVVASLIFVGYQLRQQSRIELAKAQRDLLVTVPPWNELMPHFQVD